MNRKQVSMMVAAVLLGVAMGAAAKEPRREVVVRSTTVGFADLDLRKTAGVATLHWRLRQAAHNLCSYTRQGTSWKKSRRECRSEALDGALAQLPSALREYHVQWLASRGSWLGAPLETTTRQATARR